MTTTETSELVVTTTKTSVSTATVTATTTQTTPETKVVEQTKLVPTTVKETLTETKTVEVPTTITKSTNAEPEPSTNKGSVEGSSTAGIILTVLSILFGLLAAIFAVLVNVNPQWFQDLRNQFNF
ncbi:hypothetical protein A0K93_03160 [Corynebacterium sp. BCW_4722]|nr:hypothetical protein A0K93_03160 [Corynebacterium sp. BCW_4722]